MGMSGEISSDIDMSSNGRDSTTRSSRSGMDQIRGILLVNTDSSMTGTSTKMERIEENGGIKDILANEIEAAEKRRNEMIEYDTKSADECTDASSNLPSHGNLPEASIASSIVTGYDINKNELEIIIDIDNNNIGNNNNTNITNNNNNNNFGMLANKEKQKTKGKKKNALKEITLLKCSECSGHCENTLLNSSLAIYEAGLTRKMKMKMFDKDIHWQVQESIPKFWCQIFTCFESNNNDSNSILREPNFQGLADLICFVNLMHESVPMSIKIEKPFEKADFCQDRWLESKNSNV